MAEVIGFRIFERHHKSGDLAIERPELLERWLNDCICLCRASGPGWSQSGRLVHFELAHDGHPDLAIFEVLS